MALVIVLQLLSNYVSFGPVSITLSLIPIVVGSILFGPISGAILGLANGAIILTAPSTSAFLSYNLGATVAVCLIKTTLAGFLSGLVYKLLAKNHHRLGVILSSILAPIVNTGIFTIFCFTIFYGLFQGAAGETSVVSYVFLTVLGLNFIVEFSINAILSPVVLYIINVVDKKRIK